MTPASQIPVAWQGLRRRPVRSVLTAVSLAVGVLAIVLIQACSTSMARQLVLDSMLDSGPATSFRVPVESSRPDMVAPALQAMLHARVAGPGVRAVLVIDHPELVVSLDGQSLPTLGLTAVDPALRGIRPYPVLNGQWFDRPSFAPQLVLNAAAWTAHEWPSGSVRLAAPDRAGGDAVSVVGVVHDGSRQPHAYLNLNGSGSWRQQALQTGTLTLLLQAPALDGPAARLRLEAASRGMGLPAKLGEATREDQQDGYVDTLNSLRMIFLAVAALSLLVGSLGILNIGLATLHERADELALRRALGATLGEVVTLVLLECQLVALLGAGAAAAGSWFALPVLLKVMQPAGTPIHVAFPMRAALLGLSVGACAALLGALLPAVRAAWLPISRVTRA